jgi:deoxyribodipyrimidine photolyase
MSQIRMGERYYIEHPIGRYFASNNGGRAFEPSTGVDLQPYLHIFNPLRQS